jgi:hypothetical protein
MGAALIESSVVEEVLGRFGDVESDLFHKLFL